MRSGEIRRQVFAGMVLSAVPLLAIADLVTLCPIGGSVTVFPRTPFGIDSPERDRCATEAVSGL